MLILFNDEAIQCLVSAAKMQSGSIEEPHYLFKKKLIQVCLLSII